jgi:aquaporin Z
MKPQIQKYIGELIGTFALVFAGTGAIISNDMSDGAVTHVGIAITFGLIVMAMIYAVGDLSGAHINPAVTVGFLVARRLSNNEAVGYIISQIIGGLLASLILKGIFPGHSNLGITLPAIEIYRAFVLEVILTFILMFVIIHIATGAKEKGLIAGAAVGATIGLESMFAGPVTGASMNPARSLAPAIVSGQIQHLWIYLIAPFVGAILAIAIWNLMKNDT